jgi:ketopantoate hydroxymethyltransferase
MQRAFRGFMDDVEAHAFPAAEHSVEMTDVEWEKFVAAIKS